VICISIFTQFLSQKRAAKPFKFLTNWCSFIPPPNKTCHRLAGIWHRRPSFRFRVRFVVLTAAMVKFSFIIHHSQPLFVTISPYPSLSVTLRHYKIVSVTISHYLQLSVTISHYLPLSVIISYYPSLSATIRHYPSLSVTIHHCQPLFVTISYHQPL